MALKYLLFDFDGTIAESSDGIIASMQYALNKSGINISFTNEEICRAIGPPLQPMIKRLFGNKINNNIADNIAVNYRRHYSQTGLYKVKLYDGIKKMLHTLDKKYSLYIVSSKPKDFIAKLTPKLEIESFFKGIYGPGLELSPTDKGNLIAELRSEIGCGATECIMIGDKAEDVIAAKQNDIKAIGITYGYGTLIELKEAKADIIVDTPEGIITSINQIESI